MSYRGHAAKEYDAAIKLRHADFSYADISRELNIPSGTIFNWVNRRVIPYEKRFLINKEKFKKDKYFNYIQGVIMGDGSTYYDKKKSRGAVYLTVKSLEFAKFFMNYLEKWSGKKCFLYNADGRWRVALQSIAATDFLLKNKSVINIEFLKGFYDSEGGVLCSKFKTFYATRISLTNTNLILLKKIQKYLKHNNVTSHIVLHAKKGQQNKIHGIIAKCTKNCYRLYIYSDEGIMWFYENVGFRVIKRQDALLKCVNYVQRVERQKRQCVKCGYTWKSIVLNPLRCPKCYTRKWKSIQTFPIQTFQNFKSS